MRKKIFPYGLLAFFSFVFFSSLFQTIAYAQTMTPEQQHYAETGIAPTTAYPTPTIYIAPSQAEEIQSAVFQNGKQSTKTPTATSTTPSSPTPTPTDVPTATPTPTITTAPIQTTSLSNPGGLNADVLFSMVNDYRSAKGLPAFQKEDRVCSLAASRAPEIANEVASGTMHSGLHARNLPYWNTENIISMNSEAAAFNWWINDTIHREAIESSNTYSCVACSGNSCAEEFTSFQAK